MATKTAKIEVQDGDILTGIREFLKSVMQTDEIAAMLVPMRLPMKQVIMPVLVTDHKNIDNADPLSPSFPINAASLVSRLTRKPSGGKIAAILRPCEIRAFIELVKLNQGKTDDLVMIGIDCFGVYTNKDYRRLSEKDHADVSKDHADISKDRADISIEKNSTACKSCEHPIPYGADILIGILGVDRQNNLLVQGLTDKGTSLINLVGLAECEEPPDRKPAIRAFIESRKEYRDRMIEQTSRATDTLEKLTSYMADCVNCYNCRVACPVCYCKECVFVTDVFEHEPAQYLQWSARKGAIKMPTDTIFYHLTRMAHMGTACVGCGQCSNACPNDIPVMELFKTIACRTQKAFEYEAGRSLDEQPPLSEFRENEFTEIVGIK
ncbi:MAG: Coenzyme F420 hydrogenase/dehydrogenase, beta subunit C-terminal domain [Desulfamplus sp.]|nr:Coenzyme F420 hydrogenase/dehydrogenase, beta subunit C-terminal domain [Desulfamplus sp.]